MKKIFKIIPVIMLTILFSTTVYASNLANPDYEVKLLMDTSKILDCNGNLINGVISTFNISSSENLNVQYLDTQNLDLNNQGWIVRMRKFDGDDNTQITYKKRYAVSNGDINSALKEAANDGFDGSEDDYSAQIDWGYESQTLSFSDVKQGSDEYTGLQLPDQEDAIDLAINNMPGKLNKWLYKGWAKGQLNSSVLHGPYSGKRYIGQWNGLKIELDVYNINRSDCKYIAEISFKTDKYKQAGNQRQNLINQLSSEGWLVKSDESKTGIMLGD